MTSRQIRCPRCGRAVPRTEPAFPFCSKRCRMIDLGKWFNEEYRVESKEPASSPAQPDEDLQ